MDEPRQERTEAVPPHRDDEATEVRSVKGGRTVAVQRSPGATTEPPRTSEDEAIESPQARMTGEGAPPDPDEEQ
ncbi:MULTISPECIES: hypothetical protein [unclassified Kitasatospora]|uniref:hypothetical protein n=1 Tax=unclassified Kitasatospora TaxID=2633591 RepID=UPI00070B17C2|nr:MULTISPECIES: hypothetical protein [unclassified Kitasatospora]KQV17476.1 hypothetical protein ASC99_25185 [Kitasatospora sp. Root107]KRB69276.1 hypothetical protein ASE03_27990 [Kitasatospora sp. Root187]